MNFSTMSNKAILQELGMRIQRSRLTANISQLALARRAGVARKVIQNIESSRSCTLAGLLRILRVLGLLDNLDAFLPEPGPSPIQLARLKGRERQRASVRRRKRMTKEN